jgi:hypothetical protein
MRRLLVVSVVLLLIVPGAAAGKATPSHGTFAGKIPIGGGRVLYLKCRGTGSPTVLLEAGLRNTAGGARPPTRATSARWSTRASAG